jgi:hypothetical protein
VVLAPVLDRGIDPLCPVWSALDLLPADRGDWYQPETQL